MLTYRFIQEILNIFTLNKLYNQLYVLNYSNVQKQEIFGNRAGICKPNNDHEIVGIVCWFW